MKNKKIIILMLLTTVLLALSTKVQAVIQIEVKPSTTQITNVTISESFQTCRDLDSVSSTLGTTELDPHLITNKDWGAVSYLSNSIYGTNTLGGNNGVAITMTVDGTDYTFYSTNGNETGIMNFGQTITHTAGILENAINVEDIETTVSSDTYANIKTLVNNKDTRYVEKLVYQNKVGLAFRDIEGLGSNGFLPASAFGSQLTLPVSLRQGLFAYIVGSGNNWWASNRG